MRHLSIAVVFAAVAAVASPAHAQPMVGEARAVTPDVASEGQRHSRIAAGADGFLVVWAAGVGGNSHIRAARVGLDGLPRDPSGFTVVSAAGGQFEPAVAFGHGVYFVVWSDMRDGDHVLRGARISLDGRVLDPGGVVLSTESTTARMGDVAATPDGFVVAWAQAEPALRGFLARARRLDADGRPIDAAPLQLTDAEPWSFGEDFGRRVITDVICQHIRVAVQGQSAMILWGGTVGRQQGLRIIRTSLDLETGTVRLEPDMAVVGSASRIYNPVIGVLGDGFLFSWADLRTRGSLGLPLDNAGLLELDGSVTYAPLSADHESRAVWSPAIAGNGVVAFVSPRGTPDRRVESQLVLRQILPDGSSPGADTVVEANAAWPAISTHSSGVSLLAYTLVNAPVGNGTLRARLVTLP